MIAKLDEHQLNSIINSDFFLFLLDCAFLEENFRSLILCFPCLNAL
ncbi:hypothetical protein M069_5816 [Bacteroides fragilis str. B1 (UDC16-1)]|nr:hypothetical protein M069_5816 [Bacteroides fragilis str. B1 (UDC16-1)]